MKQKRELARNTQRNSQVPCRVNHEKRTFPTLCRCRYWTAAIFNENQILFVSKTFGLKKSFESFFDAVIGSRLCLVKFHHARLHCLAPSSSFVFALASIGFHPQKIPHRAFDCARSNSIAACAFICARSNSFVFACNDASFC